MTDAEFVRQTAQPLSGHADDYGMDLYSLHASIQAVLAYLEKSLLAHRLVCATRLTKQLEQTRDLRIGFFGSSTGGGAALVAAAKLPECVGAVVSRGGRPDLAGDAFPNVESSDVAHRRRLRRCCDRSERNGSSSNALRSEAGDCSRVDTSL